MKPKTADLGWEVASWAIVLFLIWGGYRFFRSARQIYVEKEYVHPSGHVFSEAERRRVVIVHAFFGAVAWLGAALAAVGLLLY